MKHYLILAPLLVFLISSIYAGTYLTDNVDCDGFPRIKVETLDGTCMGLIKQGVPLKRPRAILPHPDEPGNLFITDMGGWTPGRGSVFFLKKEEAGHYSFYQILSKLNMPHAIDVGPDGKVYVGESHQIFRIEYSESRTIARPVITGLPYDAQNKHPLTHFLFLKPSGDLLVNIGASTDQCLKDARKEKCSDEESVGLRRYKYLGNGEWDQTYTMFATGLRNSMALAQHDSGTILQAENNMDFKALNEPHEELNIVSEGEFYGWPYCYNYNAYNPAWRSLRSKCETHTKPYTLIPSHSAPLGMTYYHSEAIPALKDKLLISLHGYRAVGHRIIAYDVNDKGLPPLQNTAYFYESPTKAVTTSSNPRRVLYAPTGGFTNTGPKVAQHIEVTPKWYALSGVRPRGNPVGIAVDSDGALIIADDKNYAILRLAAGQTYKDSSQDGNTPPQKEEKLYISSDS